MSDQKILIFDGGIGTELYERGFYINRPFEELNKTAPSDVKSIHEAYLRAGAEVITTNTFSITRPQLKKFDIEDQQATLLTAAIDIARSAVQGTSAQVGVSIGPLGVLLEPLGPLSFEEAKQNFAEVAKHAHAHGKFDLYILETFASLDELKCAIEGIRREDKTHPILASMTFKSTQKNLIEKFAAEVGTRDDVKYLGINCSEGPSDLLSSLKILAPLTKKPIIVQPNAGIPRQLNGRYFYMTSPDYMAKFAKRFIDAGAAGVGGCCGTGPDHIRAIRNSVRMMNSKVTPGELTFKTIETEDDTQSIKKPTRDWKDRKASDVGQVLRSGKKLISIEVSSPKGTDLSGFLKKMNQLADAGIRFVNIPDGARASTRVSSLHLSSLVNREFGGKLRAIPHFTTRDRNLIALQSDLLGAYVNGVRDVLLITGDPPKLGTNKDATAVYDIDALGLTHLVSCLNRNVSPNGDDLGSGTEYGIGVASNPTAVNLELELQRYKWKVESGADFAVTQPIYDPETYLRWKDKLGTHDRPHIVGIWPFISLRNAEFMANEVPGVYVPQWALDEMSKAGDNGEEAKKRGVEIARRVMEKINDACQGYAISAPLNKVEVALECIP